MIRASAVVKRQLIVLATALRRAVQAVAACVRLSSGPASGPSSSRSILCHGVQTTLDLIAGYCNVPKEEITFVCGGINHMDWFLKLEHKGRDLYPHDTRTGARSQSRGRAAGRAAGPNG